MSAQTAQVVDSASPAAKRALRIAVELLGRHFNIEAGQYADGWSDEKIAAETGMAKEAVANFRRDAYGDFKDPELAALKSEIASLLSIAGELRERVEKLEASSRR